MSESQAGSGTKSVAELLIAVPILHLIATSLFLIGYYYSFGGRLHSFSTSSDLFATSIGNVGFNYISTLSPGIVFILWHRANFGAWSLQDSVDTKPAGPVRDAALERANSDRTFFRFLVGLMIICQLILVIITYFKLGHLPYSFIGFFISILTVAYIVWYSGRINIPTLTMHIINFIVIMLLTCLFNGLTSGQFDRRLLYKDAIKNAVVCPLGAILRPIGDNFLVLTSDNDYVVSDKECKIVGKLARS
ncbi:hypothetical protein E5A73_12640 [Sphingomonas gei]|uniref:Uncharacterized protein n=1 Tax=Sphingomonas gei TaxID=1395960 RepID=A0A4S1XC76_9SPHN|nr:hypothetical protein [Sphingomonas gei]TGX53661.1 hypothetical protein E5A73_12640 [Sphingomonas gei]